MARIAVKNILQTNVVPVGKVIKATDYQHLLEAKHAIDHVREQAELLYQQEKDNAHAAAEAETQQQICSQMLGAAAGLIDYLAVVETELVDVVIKAVKKIIGDVGHSEVAAGVVKSALYKLRNESRVTLRMATSQAEAFKQSIAEISAAYPNIDFIDLVPDPTIAENTCRLEAPTGTIETSVDMQIAALQQALMLNFTDTTSST